MPILFSIDDTYTYVRTYLHTYIHMYIHTYVHTYIRMHSYVHLHAAIVVSVYGTREACFYIHIHDVHTYMYVHSSDRMNKPFECHKMLRKVR